MDDVSSLGVFVFPLIFSTNLPLFIVVLMILLGLHTKWLSTELIELLSSQSVFSCVPTLPTDSATETPKNIIIKRANTSFLLMQPASYLFLRSRSPFSGACAANREKKGLHELSPQTHTDTTGQGKKRKRDGSGVAKGRRKIMNDKRGAQDLWIRTK